MRRLTRGTEHRLLKIDVRHRAQTSVPLVNAALSLLLELMLARALVQWLTSVPLVNTSDTLLLAARSPPSLAATELKHVCATELKHELQK